MPWYERMNVLEVLDSLKKEELAEDKPFRCGSGRITTKTVICANCGRYHRNRENIRGDEVIFIRQEENICKIPEAFNRSRLRRWGRLGMWFHWQTDIRQTRRNSVSSNAAKVTGRMLVNLFWLGRNPCYG